MLNKTDERVNIPIIQIRPEYIEAIKSGWEQYEAPMTTWTDKQWDSLMERMNISSPAKE